MGIKAAMREQHVQWPSSQKAAILVLLITGTATRQQHTDMFPLTWIRYFLFIFYLCVVSKDGGRSSSVAVLTSEIQWLFISSRSSPFLLLV